MGGRTFECLDAVINRYIFTILIFRKSKFDILTLPLPYHYIADTERNKLWKDILWFKQW